MANLYDWHGSGGILFVPVGLDNQFILTPESPVPAVPGPAIITSYDITQTPTGNGVVLLFFDTITPPVDGSAWFDGANATNNVRFAVPILPGGAFVSPAGPPAHQYRNGFSVVMSTSWTQVVRANKQTLFGGAYLPFSPGR